MCHALVTPGCISEWLHWPKWSKHSSVSRITSRKKPRSSACVTSSFNTTPSMAGISNLLPVGPVRAHPIVDRVVRVHRFAGIPPEAVEDVVFHQAALDVPVIDVGDLELTAPGGLEVGQHAPHRLVIEVDARDRVIAGRVLGFLDDLLDATAPVQLGDTQVAQMLMVGLLGQDNAGAVVLLAESLDAVTDRLAEDVVAEQDHHSIAADELFRQAQRLGDSSRLLLVRVKEPVDPELLPVAEQTKKLACMRTACHQHHLGHARLDEGLDRVADHRPVVDRQQVFVGDAGQRVQPASRSTSEDDALHTWRILLAGSGRLRSWETPTHRRPPPLKRASPPMASGGGTGRNGDRQSRRTGSGAGTGSPGNRLARPRPPPDAVGLALRSGSRSPSSWASLSWSRSSPS